MRMTPNSSHRLHRATLAAAVAAALAPGFAFAQAGPASVNVSTNTLNFGNVPVNTTSGNLTSTLTSNGAVNWSIFAIGTPSCFYGGICYGGAEFSCSTTCVVSYGGYAPGTGCTLSGNFHPTVLGPQSVTVEFCDNALGSPRTITLTGNGVPPPVLTMAPAFYDFGDVPVGSTSPRAIFNVQNPGSSPVDYSTFLTGPFVVAGTTCSNQVPAFGMCDFDVTFDPTAPGPASGAFYVQPSSGGAAASASLAGNGSVTGQLLLPGNIDFNFVLGGAPSTQSLTLQNVGLAGLDISGIFIEGPFTLVNNCPAFLAPGASCTLLLGFEASDRGEFTGFLNINTSAGLRRIRLSGIAQPKAVALLEVLPLEIGFGDQALGTVGDGELIKIRNTGGAPAVFSSIVVSPDFRILSHTCQAPLAPGATCTALVAIRALGYGTRSGKFVVNSNAENGPNSVNVFGTGCRGSGISLGRVGITRGCP
jgi:hypothetical protein